MDVLSGRSSSSRKSISYVEHKNDRADPVAKSKKEQMNTKTVMEYYRLKMMTTDITMTGCKLGGIARKNIRIAKRESHAWAAENSFLQHLSSSSMKSFGKFFYPTNFFSVSWMAIREKSRSSPGEAGYKQSTKSRDIPQSSTR